MNDRIRKLAREATEYCESNSLRAHIPVTLNWGEKLADLVVQECARIAEQCIDDEFYDVGNEIRRQMGMK